MPTNNFDWTTADAALSAALSGVGSADLKVGLSLKKDLESLGHAYDRGFTADVDTAKGLWLAGASSAWDAADRAARLVEGSLPGGAGPALTFDAYDNSALSKRLAAAAKNARTSAQKDIVAIYSSAFDNAYTAPFVPYTAPQVRFVQAGPAPARNSALIQEVMDAAKGPIIPAHNIIIVPELRSSELVLVAKVADVTAFIATISL